jgi:uncharacterized membrane protein
MELKQYIIKKSRSTRFIELDLIRGFAITFMIALHFLWDLDYFGLFPLNKSIYQLNIIVPTMFFLLAGICITVSTNKKPITPLQIRHLILRGGWILSLGMILTFATYLFLPERPILFGVLHCIGVCIIISIPFIKIQLRPLYTIISAAVIIGAGLILWSIPIQQPTIFHLVLGLHDSAIWQHTIDYFPLLPWFGVCLLGMALGNILYKNHQRQFRIPDLSRYKPVSLFSWLGKHSLVIYLIHQPLLAGVITAFLLI